jgi:four helix bundle protein
MIKDVTDLEIYKLALNLLPRLYILLNMLPKSENYLVDQSKRSGTSIPSNIAEGFAKRIFELEFKRYLLIALASCDELISHLRTIQIIVPELTEEAGNLINEYKTLAKRINRTRSVWHFKGITSSDLI